MSKTVEDSRPAYEPTTTNGGGGQVEPLVSHDLPEVGGRRLVKGTLKEFEHRCKVYLDREQRKPFPDNGLVDILCDAVRVKREYCDFVEKEYKGMDGRNQKENKWLTSY